MGIICKSIERMSQLWDTYQEGLSTLNASDHQKGPIGKPFCSASTSRWKNPLREGLNEMPFHIDHQLLAGKQTATSDDAETNHEQVF